MFYSLPTEEPTGQGRFVRTEDLIDGIQEFTMFEDADSEYEFQVTVRAFLQTVDKEEEFQLKFKTKDARDVGIASMLRDLWNFGLEEESYDDRRPAIPERESLGNVQSKSPKVGSRK